MKERPILFSAPMVRAILEGRKTQTRRAVKPKIVEDIELICGGADGEPPLSADLGLAYERMVFEDSRGFERTAKRPQWLVHSTEYPEEGSMPIGQGYGAVGDRLWVRETFALEANYPTGTGAEVFYRADLSERDVTEEQKVRRVAQRLAFEHRESCWRPSIHMPRWASRILLQITEVRIERLQDISESDAMDEGVGALVTGAREGNPDQYRTTFRDLWGSINGAESWAANPWVWVISFERVNA